jgi:ribulose-phosphate 3-epimerase
MKIEISPSILACDFGKMNEDISSIEAFSDRLHIDVMDGHFVPNISFGVPVLKWIKSDLPQDCHLMISEPWKYAKDFVEAGATIVIVHSEVYGGDSDGGSLEEGLKALRELGCGVGVSIKPATPVSDIADVLRLVDQVLIMTVEPGFGGQKFMADMLPKVKELKEMGFEGDIGIDGGVNAETGAMCKEAGANLLIAGSYVFKSDDRESAIEALR